MKILETVIVDLLWLKLVCLNTLPMQLWQEFTMILLQLREITIQGR